MNVTVVICTYNSGAYLKPSVLSVLEQTYDDYEIVVVDDGSTDGSVRELDSIRSEKLRIFHQANQGKSAALNFASKVAHGEWIVIQDADDLAHPERLSRLAAAVDGEDQLAAVFSGYDIIFNERRVAPISKTKDVAQCRADIESFRMPSHDPTMMVRTNLVRSLQFND